MTGISIATPVPGSVAAHAVRYIDLAPSDALRVADITGAEAEVHSTSYSELLLERAFELSHHLPLRIINALRELRQRETSAAVVIRGLPVGEQAIGPTPLDWRTPPGAKHALTLRTHEITLIVASAVLGEIYGWATVQDGALVHDVLPIPGHHSVQSGHGTVRLVWHTEDAFHPYRADYLLALCLRNPDAVPTTVASIRDVALHPQVREVLAQPRFLLHPDTEQLTRADELAHGQQADHLIQPVWRAPVPTRVLFADQREPYLRIDPAFMSALPGDAVAAAALDELTAALDANLVEVPLAPGDLLVIDNYTAVHGSAPFTAKFDGTDRWLKRVLVTRDLRRSRAARGAVHDRVVSR